MRKGCEMAAVDAFEGARRITEAVEGLSEAEVVKAMKMALLSLDMEGVLLIQRNLELF